MSHHVAVWIDHKEAKIFHVTPSTFDIASIEAPHHHVHRKAEEQGRHALEAPYFQEVAAALGDAREILVVGPSSAKLDFLRYLHKHNHAVESRVVGIETLGHPTDGQLAGYVRHYFRLKEGTLEVTH